VIGIIAQRLVRTFCGECKGKGCKRCLNTGYKGRKGIYELLIPNEEIRRLTNKKASLSELRQEALKTGMRGLRDDGLQKVKEGITSEEEVLRVVME